MKKMNFLKSLPDDLTSTVRAEDFLICIRSLTLNKSNMQHVKGHSDELSRFFDLLVLLNWPILVVLHVSNIIMT